MDTFAERFKYARQNAGLSLSTVAEHLDVSPQAVWNYENRPDGGVAVELLFPLADVLGVDARWLATGAGAAYTTEHRTATSIKVERLARSLQVLPDEKLQALSVVLGIKL